MFNISIDIVIPQIVLRLEEIIFPPTNIIKPLLLRLHILLNVGSSRGKIVLYIFAENELIENSIKIHNENAFSLE